MVALPEFRIMNVSFERKILLRVFGNTNNNREWKTQ
jgi:hypothetical protein